MNKKVFGTVLGIVICFTLLLSALPVFAGRTPSPEDGPEHITVAYLYGRGIPENLADIQAQINGISEREIGVHVELRPVWIDDAMNEAYFIMLGRGESLDLINAAYEDIQLYIRNGAVRCLNDLIASDGQGILGIEQECPVFDGMMQGDQIYGILRVNRLYGYQNCVVMQKEFFEETGPARQELYTFEQLTELFGQVKQRHPDCYPLCVVGDDAAAGRTNSGCFLEYCPINAGVNAGVLMDYGSTTIVNLFETPQYRDYLKQLREWAELGYILPDAAMNDSAKKDLLASHACVSEAKSVYIDHPSLNQGAFGGDVAMLYTSPGYYISRSSKESIYWMVTSSSEHPQAAMRFLDLLYTNEELANLWVYGTTEPAAVTAYSYAANDRLVHLRETEYDWREGLDWSAQNMERTYKAYGYSYDASAMRVVLMNIDNILDAYLPLLETGSVEDWEPLYRQMLAELDAAGIQEVIADNQEQFNRWLRAKK